MKRVAPYLLVIAAALVVSALLPAPEKQAKADTADIAKATGIRVLGATRGYATTALWLRAGDSYRRGDLYETLATYQLIRELQPRNPAVYSYLSWNQAYNISAQFPDRERREEWIERGLRTLHEGQDQIPADATLRLDEWHFLLNRSEAYIAATLRVEVKRLGDANPKWRILAERALELYANLGAEDASELDVFLREVGLQIDLFDLADAVAALPDTERARLLDPEIEDANIVGFDDYDRYRATMLFNLGRDTLAFLALAHWVRLHAMTLALEPALDMEPRPLGVESALLNTWKMAYERIPPILPDATREEIEQSYKEAVANTFLSGIENALRIGGQEDAVEFVERMKFNFEGLPELLPPELTDKALQEIQE